MTKDAHSTEELDTPQSHRVQRREWFAERVGWVVLGAILCAAVIGLLGPGWLSHRVRESPDGTVQVEYYAFERHVSPAELRIRVRPMASSRDRVRLQLSSEFAEEMSITEIAPEPDSVELQNDRIVYEFKAADVQEGLIIFRYQGQGMGTVTYQLGLENEPAIEMSQFVFP